MTSEKLLEIKDLYVQYETDDGIFHSVNGVNLTLHKGETMGLVGETGAGKTTTCLSVMRLLPKGTGIITNGSIYYKGENLLDKSIKEIKRLRGKEISMVFQDPMTSLNPVYTVNDQIAETISIHNSKLSKNDVEKQVDLLLSMIGIPPERKNEYPHQFSGGMKQRIIIAMALACQPELLLADEPTTALDVTIQAQVLRLMKDLKTNLGTAMILVTHDLGIVAQNCDTVAIMYAGNIVESGSIRDVFKGENHHPYTVGLFGSIPDLANKASRLNPIDGLMPDPSNLPSGCKFHPRCKYATDRCKTEEPHAVLSGTHMIACHHYKPDGYMETQETVDTCKSAGKET